MAFKDIKGQASVVKYLQTALAKDRLASAYLFVGPDAASKEQVGLNLAKTINCDNSLDTDCCDSCTSCNLINKLSHPDIHILDCDNSSIKIEQIRELQQNIYLRPYQAKKKFYVINNIEKLTGDAANAFLKTLEEPPKDSLIILTANSVSGILATVLSRCQKVNFGLLSSEEVAKDLQGKFKLDKQFSEYLAKFSSGKLSSAIDLKDRNMLDFKNRVIDYFILQKISVDKEEFFLKDKTDMNLCLCVILSWLRDLLVLRSNPNRDNLINQNEFTQLSQACQKVDVEKVNETINFVFNSSVYLDQNINIKLISSIFIDKLKGISSWSN